MDDLTTVIRAAVDNYEAGITQADQLTTVIGDSEARVAVVKIRMLLALSQVIQSAVSSALVEQFGDLLETPFNPEETEND